MRRHVHDVAHRRQITEAAPAIDAPLAPRPPPLFRNGYPQRIHLTDRARYPVRTRQQLKQREVDQGSVEHVASVGDGRPAVKHRRAESHRRREQRRLVRERRRGEPAPDRQGAQGEHVKRVSHRDPRESSPAGIGHMVREHSVPPSDVVVFGHVRESHEVRHLPEVERARENATRGLDGALARGGPSHQRRHRAHHRARPRVEPVHLLQRGVAQGVERDVGGAQRGRGVVGLLPEEPDTRDAGDDAEGGGVRDGASPRRQRPSHRPGHDRIVFNLEDLVPRVRRR